MNTEVTLQQETTKTLYDFFKSIDDEKARTVLITAAVEQYKELRDSKNDLYSKNEDLEKDLDELRAKIDTSKDLFKIKDRIDLELGRFGAMGADAELSQSIRTLKERRLNAVTSVLKSFQNLTLRLSGQQNKEGSTSDTPSVRARILFLPVSITLISSVTLFLLTQQVVILLLGIGIVILNAILFLLINVTGDVRFDHKDVFSIDYSGNQNNEYQRFVEQFNRQENALFVNAAWIQALHFEKSKVLNAIQTRLGGRSFFDIDNEIQSKLKTVANNTEEINKIIAIIMNAEEYLQIRRELDVLQINYPDLTETIESLTIKNIERLDQKVKGIIIGYLNFAKGKGIIQSISYL